MKKDQPHDKFFKQVFSHRQIVLDYFRNFVPPKLINDLDLRTLQRTDGNYIDDEMGAYFSDMSFRINWKKGINKENSPKVYLLVEHKSYVPKFIHVQLLKYMVEIWMDDIKNKKDLTLVIPIVIYHGKRKWKYRSFYDFFDLPNENFKEFIPNFEYILTDLNDYSDEEILMLQIGFLTNAFLAMKHSGDENYLRKYAIRIFKDGEEFLKSELGVNLMKILSIYLSKTTKLEPKNVNKIFQDLPKKIKELAMTTYDKFVKQGLEQGLEQGEEKGRIKEREKTKTIIKEIIIMFPNMTDVEISKRFKADIALVKEVREKMKS